MKTCTFERCSGPHHAQSLCQMHYRRLKRTGRAEGKNKIRLGGSHTRGYKIWKGMLARCYDARNNRFQYYGGRGIGVCPQWRESYDTFLTDMGRSPSPQHSLDRINTNGNYEPSNCRWATPVEQANNRRKRSCCKQSLKVA